MRDPFDVLDEFNNRIDDFHERREKYEERAERIQDALEFMTDAAPTIGYMALDTVGELISNLFDN